MGTRQLNVEAPALPTTLEHFAACTPTGRRGGVTLLALNLSRTEAETLRLRGAGGPGPGLRRHGTRPSRRRGAPQRPHPHDGQAGEDPKRPDGEAGPRPGAAPASDRICVRARAARSRPCLRCLSGQERERSSATCVIAVLAAYVAPVARSGCVALATRR